MPTLFDNIYAIKKDLDVYINNKNTMLFDYVIYYYCFLLFVI